MRYYTVEIGGTEKVAASADGKKLFVLPQFVDMNDLIAKGGVAQISEDAQAAGGDVKILSPIPRPRQDVLCLGINYAAHAVEADRFSSEAFGGERPYPIFFAKRVNYSQGPDAAIPSYKGLVDSLDYECELGVIIGKDAFHVRRENTADYIFGYTIINDVSARNLQTRLQHGKSDRGHCRHHLHALRGHDPAGRDDYCDRYACRRRHGDGAADLLKGGRCG